MDISTRQVTNDGNPKIKCADCLGIYLVDDAYRCFYCGFYLCKGCAQKHFERDAEIEVADADRKAAHYRMLRALDKLM